MEVYLDSRAKSAVREHASLFTVFSLIESWVFCDFGESEGTA